MEISPKNNDLGRQEQEALIVRATEALISGLEGLLKTESPADLNESLKK